ncbi:hypothetical protein H310_15091 [Aphanomyces invadans]|uniref:Uncharacterized protein n=1 Tax=Aphanomyces invadans TaxID=157072 RepID=A0A024T8X4_9STRA|nr:hypothetical protein H310_15091 [Aphanomyces invadans]ETV90081.1 hypothetical protein H310_15091 [Aphanomyces invadans]|eukprot:XP_008881289.1 hypothetical protein H310_15091 [Aphanomyces invadans]
MRCCGGCMPGAAFVGQGVLACCCPCVSLAQISSRLDIIGGYYGVLCGSCGAVVGALAAIVANVRSQSILSDPSLHSTSSADDSLQAPFGIATLSLACSVALVVYTTLLREHLRQRRGIKSSIVADYLCAACCPCCCIAHMAIEAGTPESYKSCPIGPCAVLPAYEPK